MMTSRLGDPSPERGGRAKRYYTMQRKAIDELRGARRALINMWDGLTPITE